MCGLGVWKVVVSVWFFLTKNSVFFSGVGGGVFYYKLTWNPNLTKKSFFFLFLLGWGGGGGG